jgi:putative ABC transport system ATP-binding protein
MELALKGVVPIPLQEKLSAKKSDIWLKSILISAPEYIAIQAPSGTGKTTLIHSLYGIRTDYIGDILWDNESLRNRKSESLSELRATKISVIFQDMRLFPDLTAWENLEIKRSISNTITEKEISEWMVRLGIGDKKESLAQTLSYGEQQRLAIIRALLQPFSFLLMDEPFSHLDHKNTLIAAELILEVTQRNKAGLILADLDENTFFPYHKTLML